MLFMFIMGIFLVVLVILMNRNNIQLLGNNEHIIMMLRERRWFQSSLSAGMCLFSVNAVLFLVTMLISYMSMSFMSVMLFIIPLFPVLVLIGGVIASLFLWELWSRAWQGTNFNRLKMGMIGSSFYLLLTCAFVYWYVVAALSNGRGTIGLLPIIVTTIAFFSCFFITSFAKKETQS